MGVASSSFFFFNTRIEKWVLMSHSDVNVCGRGNLQHIPTTSSRTKFLHHEASFFSTGCFWMPEIELMRRRIFNLQPARGVYVEQLCEMMSGLNMQTLVQNKKVTHSALHRSPPIGIFFFSWVLFSCKDTTDLSKS